LFLKVVVLDKSPEFTEVLYTRTEILGNSYGNLAGQPVGIISVQRYPTGKDDLKCNISNLSQGSYIVKFYAGDVQSAGELMVIK